MGGGGHHYFWFIVLDDHWSKRFIDLSWLFDDWCYIHLGWSCFPFPSETFSTKLQIKSKDTLYSDKYAQLCSWAAIQWQSFAKSLWMSKVKSSKMTKVATAISVTSGSLPLRPRFRQDWEVLLLMVHVCPWTKFTRNSARKSCNVFHKWIFAKFAMFIIYAQFWRGPLGTIRMIHHLIPRTHHSYVSCIFAHNAY